MMIDNNKNTDATTRLLWAGVFEFACIVVGVALYFTTGNILWLPIGIIAGLGFSLPALIKYLRTRRGDKNAG